MNKFHSLSLRQRNRLSVEELVHYYEEVRIYRYEKGVPLKGIRIRKLLYPMQRKAVSMLRKKLGWTFEKIGDKCSQVHHRPVIYACAHTGKGDIELSYEAAGKGCWFLIGDPGNVFRSMWGIFMRINGVIYLNTEKKEDRKIAKERSLELLKRGGRLLIFPEGAWNVTENQVIMPLFSGATDMAVQTDAVIIPMAVDHFGKHYYVNIGANIDSRDWKGKERSEQREQLREALSTLRWEIWEHRGREKRNELPENVRDLFYRELLKDTGEDYTLEDMKRTAYHERNIADPDTVFAPIRQLCH